MKLALVDLCVTDDYWQEFNDNERFIRNEIPMHLYQQDRVSFELEWIERDFTCQTQTIRIWIHADEEKYLTWFLMQYNP